jgi:MFS family permease
MWSRAIPILLLVVVLLVANGILVTLLPLRWMDAGIPAVTVSTLAAWNYFGILVGGAFAMRIVARVGCRAAFVSFAATLAGTTLVFLVPASLPIYAAARGLGGFALSGLYVLIESRLNAIASPERRGRLLSSYMITFYVAQACGSALSGTTAWSGGALLVAASCLVAVSAVLFSVATSPPGAAASIGFTRAIALLRESPDGYVGGLAAGVLLGSFYGVGPLFAASVLSASNRVGLFMAAAMFGGVCGLWPIGAAADRYGHKRASAWLNLGAASSSLLLVAVSYASDLTVLAGALTFGAIGFSLYPVSSAAINARVPAADRLTANSLFVLVAGLGGCMGPLLTAGFTPFAGSAALFITIAATGLLTAIFIFGSSPSRIFPIVRRCEETRLAARRQICIGRPAQVRTIRSCEPQSLPP